MVTLDQKGNSTGLLVSLICMVLLFIGAASAAAWAYSGRQDYKNNVDAKVQVAVTGAVAAEDKVKQAQFNEDYKQPLKPYSGPSAFGSIRMTYPKTWSAYIVEKDASGGTNLDGYFYPDYVPDVSNPDNSYALRLQVLSQSYSSVIQQYDSAVKTGKVTASPYKLNKVPSVVGERLDGALSASKNGSMIILPLRDKTLKVWTEGSLFTADYNTNILPNLSFSP